MQPQYKSGIKKLQEKVNKAQSKDIKDVISSYILSKKTRFDKHIVLPKNMWNYVFHEEEAEGLGVIGLNPNAKHERNPLLDVARGVIYDSNLKVIISVPIDERSNIVTNSVPVVGNNVKFSVKSQNGQEVFSNFDVPLSSVKLYPNYQGIYVRLIQHNGKVYFATNSRVRVYDPNVTPDPRYMYDTRRYMRMFLDASKLLPEDLFDTANYKYSNMCHYFLLESREFSKSTYKTINKTTVYYLASYESYNSDTLPGVNFDRENRYQNKLPTINEISVEEANKLLSTGYTNNPTEPKLLSGGESVVIEGPNFGFRLTPESFLWRRSFLEPEIMDDDTIKFLKALNTPSKFTYSITLEEAFEKAGELTWSDSTPGESENYNESIQDRTISYLLGCSFYDQLKIQDLYKRTLEQPLQDLTGFFYNETAVTIVGNEKPGEKVIPYIAQTIRPTTVEIFDRVDKLTKQCEKNNLPVYECKDLINDLLKSYNVSTLYAVKRAVDSYIKNNKRIQMKLSATQNITPAVITTN